MFDYYLFGENTRQHCIAHCVLLDEYCISIRSSDFEYWVGLIISYCSSSFFKGKFILSVVHPCYGDFTFAITDDILDIYFIGKVVFGYPKVIGRDTVVLESYC